LAAKPESGFYNLVFVVTPEDKKYIGANHVHLSMKITGSAAISEVVLTLTDSEDFAELTDGKKYKPEFPKRVEEVLKVDGAQHIYVEYKVKGQTGKALQVQQAFVRLSDKSGKEAIFVSENGAKGYSTHIDLKSVSKQFYAQSGKYELELIVGDAFLQNPALWNLASLQITFPNDSKLEVPQSPFSVLPEIKHVFRLPEKRPPKIISLAFTGAVLGVPILLLCIGLLRVGASVSLPGGPGFLWAVLFQGCLGVILALFGLYWLRLNMVQTLGYLGVLIVPFLFLAQKNFNYLAQTKQHNE
jgi:oligosaccharyltransferase complex subunit delta (ribophorin II)